MNEREPRVATLCEVKGHIYGTITADRHRLEQVIINILSIAVKYSPDADLIKIRLSITKKFFKD